MPSTCARPSAKIASLKNPPSALLIGGFFIVEGKEGGCMAGVFLLGETVLLNESINTHRFSKPTFL
jgi:hypothetical protein